MPLRGLSLALVAVGERFQDSAGTTSVLSLISHSGALLRLVKGVLKSKIAGRPLLPRDLWKIRGIMSGGTDCAVLREKIKELWGRYPLDTYTCTEGCVIATQTWDYQDMSFIPYLNFLEFIPESELIKEQSDRSYKPETVLLDEVQPGETYELVITNFHGGALIRYRIGDIIRITSRRNDTLNIDIPQMIFERRADDLIDLAGYVRLTERTVWQAIENSGIPYEEWTVRKEVDEKPLVNIFLELKARYKANESEIAVAIYEEIKKLDERVNSSAIYSTLESILGTIPLKVTLLPGGTFPDYISLRQKEGADLAHVKPPHINPSDEVLLQLGVRKKVSRRAQRSTTGIPITPR
ncbi:MAG: GH3 auxin-responsive promoter family protein [Dehalococcoidia bacterium]